MPQMELTDAEAQEVIKAREQRDRRRWICEGMFLAADYLRGLGDQCAGGSGQETNPKTGEPYGAAYYNAAEALTRRAGFLSANPSQINA